MATLSFDATVINFDDPNYDFNGNPIVPVAPALPPPPLPGSPDSPDRWEVTVRHITLSQSRTGPYVLTGPPEGLGSDVRVTHNARGVIHGLHAGRAFYGGKSLRFPYAVLGDSPEDARALHEELAGAWQVPDPAVDGGLTIELRMHVAQARRTVIGSPGRMAHDWTDLPKGVVTGIFEFVATDPRLYGDEVLTTVTPQAVTGGLFLPHGMPHGFGIASSGTIIANNEGTFSSPPYVILTGQGSAGLINPMITLASTGQYMRLAGVIAPGTSVYLNFAERTVLLDGVEPRADMVERPGSTWFEIPPGRQAIGLTADGGSGVMDLTARSAWVL